jgi:FMN phosphatase YigB (HAD superfamily)
MSSKAQEIQQEIAESLRYFADSSRHLVCVPYSIENLHIMAKDLGLHRCWFHKSHYDIPIKRQQELLEKCEQVSSRDIVNIIKHGSPQKS